MFTTRGSVAWIDPESTARILIFGDLHGDLDALQKGLALRKPGDVVVFLGDYADRGSEGIEVIEGIEALQKRLPDEVIALQGNHELFSENGEPTFAPCTLIEEAEKKRGSWKTFFGEFSRFISLLHIAAILPGHYLFVHGGLGEAVEDVESLVEPSSRTREELLWSDPMEEKGTSMNMRGAGSQFGPDVTRRVLECIDARTLIRSHEPRRASAEPVYDHEGRVMTVSSTNVYGGAPFVLILDLQDPPHTEAALTEAVKYL